jgi:hypothetical protein
MVAASEPGSPLSPPSRPWRAFAVLAAVALVGLAVPVFANHVQNVSAGGSTFTVEFDHDGDNAWWVEFQARGSNGDGMFLGQVLVEGTTTWRGMNFAANDYERQQAGWSKFAPEQSFNVPDGKRVMFRVHMTDGATGNTGIVQSCWFTHPAGVEQCGTTSTTTTTGSGFNPQFTGFRGNEWWVQANVGTTSHCISKVDVRSNNGAWMPLGKQSWGPTAWAASYHFPQGSILQMRATSCSGQVDLSSCRQWIPAPNTDATIVACPGGTPQPTPFDATFTGVKGNHYWVQVNVAANEPLKEVAFRVNCAPSWIPLAKQSWGGWAPTHQVIIPQGSKVDFKATSLDGDRDASGGYIWTAATPTSGCALGAWPAPGSEVVYDLSSGVCGGGECFHADATLALTYTAENHWQGWCTGETRHTATDGTVTREPFTSRNDITPLFGKVPTSVGAEQHIRQVGVFWSSKSCGVSGNEVTYVVDHRETRQSALVDANHDPIPLDAWVADRDVSGENYEVAAFDAKLGLVFETQSYPRMSQQGSASLYVTDTDAPLR